MKVFDKETNSELREAIWIYQGTDTNGRLCAITDEEMEHHPDPIGWNRYVPDLEAGHVEKRQG